MSSTPEFISKPQTATVATMSQSFSNSCSLITLPLEVLQQVISFCPVPSIKSLRLSCKLLKELSDPVLFHSIDLFPHMKRFKQILELSEHQVVRKHVRKINYNLQFATIAYQIVEQVKNANLGDTGRPSTSVLQYVEEFRDQSIDYREDVYIEILFLQDIFRNLPNLESISVIEDDGVGLPREQLAQAPLPSFYGELQTCAAQIDPWVPHAHRDSKPWWDSVQRVVIACHSLKQPIRHLRIENAYWDNLKMFKPRDKYASLLEPFLGGLYSLTLDARLCQPDFLLDCLSNFGHMLNMATSLRNLKVRFPDEPKKWTAVDSVPPYDPIPDSSIFGLIGPPHGYGPEIELGSNLKHLDLHYMRSRSDEFLQVLQRASPTLNSLILSCFTLIPSDHTGAKPCLVSFLKGVRQYCGNVEVDLIDEFDNTGAQNWLLSVPPKHLADDQSPSIERQNLRKLVIDWVCHKREECPIEFLSILQGAPDFTHQQFKAVEGLSDQTFIVRNAFGTHPTPDNEAG